MTPERAAFVSMLKALKHAVALADKLCPRDGNGDWRRTEEGQQSYLRCVEAIAIAERWINE